MDSSFPTQFQTLFDSHPLNIEKTVSLFKDLLEGKLSEIHQAALLTLLADREPDSSVLASLARVVAARGEVFPGQEAPGAIDTCGTGGDYSGTFNISSATALVLAGCGVKVIKHGNRSASGNSGSADVFQALGVKIDCTPEISATALREGNICFCFAPIYYPFLGNFAGLRKKLGFRTVFNFIGPLVNPGHVRFQLLGVSHPRYLEVYAQAFQTLNKEGIIVSGETGGDEILLDRKTGYCSIKGGVIEKGMWDCASFGLERRPSHLIQAKDPLESAALIQEVMQGKAGPALDTVLANSAAGLLACGWVSNILAGVVMARNAIQAGKAAQALETLVKITKG